MSRSALGAPLAAVALAAGLAACRGPIAPVPPSSAGAGQSLAPAQSRVTLSLSKAEPSSLLRSKIHHVIVIVQENRSFDNLFHGFPGADTVDYGMGHGTRYRLQPIGFQYPYDVNHAHVQFVEDYDLGKMDGFDRQIEEFAGRCGSPWNHPACWIFFTEVPYTTIAYSYVPHSQSKPYWILASRYAVGDRTFASNNGPTYPSHQYLIAGQSNHIAENPLYAPWGCDSSPLNNVTLRLRPGTNDASIFFHDSGIERAYQFPCFQYKTVADELDRHRVTWTYYAAPIPGSGANYSAFDADWRVRFGRDWVRNVESPETRIFNDIAARKLAQVVWVTPSFLNSDHSLSGSTTGPDWVASIVNAIGKSPYWKDSAIVVLWDEWGGWYDHVRPPQYRDPETGVFEGLGFRIPSIVISPYAKHGYVSHHQHEIASSLHLIEKVFGLPSLGGADARADAFDDMFDLTKPASPFRPVPTRVGADYFLHQKPSTTPPDW